MDKIKPVLFVTWFAWLRMQVATVIQERRQRRKVRTGASAMTRPSCRMTTCKSKSSAPCGVTIMARKPAYSVPSVRIEHEGVAASRIFERSRANRFAYPRPLGWQRAERLTDAALAVRVCGSVAPAFPLAQSLVWPGTRRASSRRWAAGQVYRGRRAGANRDRTPHTAA